MTRRGKIGWMLVGVIAAAAGFSTERCNAEPNTPNTDWLRGARYGVPMHFLPSNEASFKLVDMGPNYDSSAGPVGTLAKEQVEQIKAVRKSLAPAPEPALPKGCRGLRVTSASISISTRARIARKSARTRRGR